MGMKPSEPSNNFTDVPEGWDELEWFQRIQNRNLRADAGLPLLNTDQMGEFSPAYGDRHMFRTVYDKFSSGLVPPTDSDGDSTTSS